MQKVIFLTLLTLMASTASWAKAGTFPETAYEYAKTLNGECTGAGAFSSQAERVLGQGSLPDPLEIERLLKTGVLEVMNL